MSGSNALLTVRRQPQNYLMQNPDPVAELWASLPDQGGGNAVNAPALTNPGVNVRPADFIAGQPVRPGYRNDLIHLANLYSGFVGGSGSVGMPRGYHATWEPFTEFDWSRLGSVTRPNVSGASGEEWAMNLARLGPWANSGKAGAMMGAPVHLPVEIGGTGKAYKSLDSLETAIRRAGGPDQFRAAMTQRGYGHVSVVDGEMGGRSFIALSPEHFRIVPE